MLETPDSITCFRCHGIMQAAKYWDLRTSGTGWYQFTCINCGEVVDDTILQNRQLSVAPLTINELKKKRRKLKELGIHKDQNQSTPPLRMDHKGLREAQNG
jgi:hypothetical protein